MELARRLQAVEVFRIAVREHLCRVSARDRQRRDLAVDDRTGLEVFWKFCIKSARHTIQQNPHSARDLILR